MKERRKKSKGIMKALFILFVTIISTQLFAQNANAAPTTVPPNSFRDQNELIFKNNASFSKATSNNSSVKAGVVKNGQFKGQNFIGWADNTLSSSDYIDIEYKNTGTYKGKNVSVTVRLSDFVIGRNQFDSDYNTTDGYKNYIIFTSNLINGFTFSGFGSTTATFKAYYTDTNEAVNFEGNSYITFNSLNGSKAVNYLGDKFTAIEFAGYEKMNSLPYFVTTTTGVGEYTNPVTNSGKVVGGIENPPTDDKFTDQVGASNFTNGSVTYTIAGQNPKFVIGSTSNMMWVTFSSSAVFNMLPEKPTKAVQDQSGKDINNKPVQAGEPITYSVKQKVNTLNIDILTKYKSFKITDVLSDKVNYVSARLLDKDKKEVDKNGSYSYNASNRTLTYTASSSFLSSMPLNGETYELEIKAKVKDDVKPDTVIKNVGTVLIDDSSQSTNEVTNTTEKPKIPEPSKEVVDTEGNSIDGEKVMSGDTIVYRVNQKTNVMDKDIFVSYSNLTIKDVLPPQVSYKDAIVKIDDVAVKDVKGISYNKEEHTVVFDADSDFLKNLKMKGEVVTLEINTTVIKEIEENEKVDNKATVNVNGDDKETNLVSNTIKVPKGDIVLTKVTDQVSHVDKEKNEPVWEENIQQGVTYKLYANLDIKFPNGKLISEKDTEYGEQTTGEDGKATFSDLYEGEYVAIEQSAPVGLQVDPTPIVVTVKAEEQGQEIVIANGNQKDERQEALIKGKKLFEQQEGTFVGSEGATFGLYYADDYKLNEDNIIPRDTLVTEMKTNSTGDFSYQSVLIPNQKYYVKEIKTLDGYLLDTVKRYFVYQPTTNEAVHEINLYKTGYVTDNKFIPYSDIEVWTKEQTNTVDDGKTEESTSSTETGETSSSSIVESQTSETEGSATQETKESGTQETSEEEPEKETPKENIISSSDKYSEPTEEQKEDIKNYLIINNSIVKAIRNGKGGLVENYDILADQETVTFEGTIYIGNNNEVGTTYKVSDVLPEGLKYKKMSVSTSQGEDVTNKVTSFNDGQSIGFTINQEYADTLKATSLVWVVETVYNHSKELEGKKLQNTMKLFVNGEEITSNTVDLTTPTVDYVEQGKFPMTGEQVKKSMQLAGVLIILTAIGIGAYTIWRRKNAKSN